MSGATGPLFQQLPISISNYRLDFNLTLQVISIKQNLLINIVRVLGIQEAVVLFGSNAIRRLCFKLGF